LEESPFAYLFYDKQRRIDFWQAYQEKHSPIHFTATGHEPFASPLGANVIVS
jgi:hypothetical protein